MAVGCSFNNNAIVENKNNTWSRIGEPTEAALLVLAEKMQGAKNFEFQTSLKNKLNEVC